MTARLPTIKVRFMKRPTKHILVGFLAGAVIFAVVCGTMKATLSTSTFEVANAIWLVCVVLTWLVWSFRGHYQVRRHRGGITAAQATTERAAR